MLEILRLQAAYSPANTVAMQRRGRLVRHALPAAVMAARTRLAQALGPYGEDLRVEGRDGLGTKTRVPWVRFHSRLRSPTARQGWYCVWLFDAAGSAVYLSLAHGSTFYEEGAFRPRPPAQLARLVAWGRAALRDVLEAEPELATPFALGGSSLAESYERASVLVRRYPAVALPEESLLLEDAVRFAGHLRRIHAAEDAGAVPFSVPPEWIETENAAAGTPGRAWEGQGGGLSPAERAAVERHGLERARVHLEALGWRVRPVRPGRPLDLEARRAGARLAVEVKSSTAPGVRPLLGQGELAALRDAYPGNALVVVHSIRLRAGPEGVVAEGGELVMLSPFAPEPGSLRPVVLEYRPAATAGDEAQGSSEGSL